MTKTLEQLKAAAHEAQEASVALHELINKQQDDMSLALKRLGLANGKLATLTTLLGL